MFSKYEFIKKYEASKNNEQKRAELLADSFRGQEQSTKHDYVSIEYFDQSIKSLTKDFKCEMELTRKEVRSSISLLRQELKVDMRDIFNTHFKWNYALLVGIVMVIIKQIFF